MTVAAQAGVDAWLLKCNPQMWDLPGFLRDGHRGIESWTISRPVSRLVVGQPVLFWVTGSAGSTPVPGLWGAGVVTGRQYVALTAEEDYWLARPNPSDTSYWLPVDIELFAAPIPRFVLAADPRLHDLAILKTPISGNPQLVTAAQLALIERYLTPRGTAAFGPLAQARATVMDAYRQAGWEVERATAAGWDLTCRRIHHELHLVVRCADRIELRRAEIVAANDPRWRLIAVDGSTLVEYDGDEALDRAEPIAYAITP